MNRGIIIQCRDESTRMKHKSVRPFYEGKSLLETIYDSLIILDMIIVVATTFQNKLTRKICEKRGYEYYDPVLPDDFVATRLYNCANEYGFEGFYRICADNPFIQKPLMFPVEAWSCVDYDYVTFQNAMERHEGFWIEYVKTEALKRSMMCDSSPETRQHVTTFIRRNPWLFKVKSLPVPDELNNINIRLTVDTKSDFNIAKKIYRDIGNPDWHEILKYLEKRPILLKKMKKNIEENPK